MDAADWDRVIETWGTGRRLSEHTRLAVEFEAEYGPRDRREPVPGCTCVRCATSAHGGNDEDADVAEWLVEQLTEETTTAKRLERAEKAVKEWEQVGCILPSPAVLCDRAGGTSKESRRVQESRSRRDPLPVDDARRVHIGTLVRRLGLGEPEGRYGEPRVLCPFHDDTNPSLRLREEKNLWYCDVCAEGGDGIRLVEKALDLEFADATRWIADGGRAGKSGIVTTGGRE